MTLSGFVIVGLRGWTGLEYGTFGRTKVDAWDRHCRFGSNYIRNESERATRRSQWAPKGWRPIPASLHISEKSP